LDVSVFGPMKKQWRAELNKFKDWCVANNVRNVTIPKDKYAKYQYKYKKIKIPYESTDKYLSTS
jgi:hypothetical protein